MLKTNSFVWRERSSRRYFVENNRFVQNSQGDTIVQLILLQKVDEKIQRFFMSDQIGKGVSDATQSFDRTNFQSSTNERRKRCLSIERSILLEIFAEIHSEDRNRLRNFTGKTPFFRSMRFDHIVQRHLFDLLEFLFDFVDQQITLRDQSLN